MPEAAAPTATRAAALQALGMLLSAPRRLRRRCGRPGRCPRLLMRRCLAISRALGDWPRVVAALRELGRLGIELGAWAAARPRLEESLAIARRLGDRDEIALTLSELGWLALFEEGYAHAASLLQESLMIFRESGDIGNASFTLFFLGHLAREQGDYAAPVPGSSRASRSSHDCSIAGHCTACLDGFACLAAAQGQAVRALRLSGAAAARREAIEAAVGRSWREVSTVAGAGLAGTRGRAGIGGVGRRSRDDPGRGARLRARRRARVVLRGLGRAAAATAYLSA